jgi:hypothetical protein
MTARSQNPVFYDLRLQKRWLWGVLSQGTCSTSRWFLAWLISSETSVDFQWITRYYIPEDKLFNSVPLCWAVWTCNKYCMCPWKCRVIRYVSLWDVNITVNYKPTFGLFYFHPIICFDFLRSSSGGFYELHM